MRKKIRIDFTNVTKNAVELVIEFDTTKPERNVLIGVYVLLVIGAFFGSSYTISFIIYPTMAVVLGLIFWVGICLGIAVLVFVIGTYIPHPKAFIISKVEGTIRMIFFYPFRKEEKIQSLSTREIEKICIHEVSGEGGSSCRLVAFMQDGRHVNLYTNPHFETINQLDTMIKNFITVLG